MSVVQTKDISVALLFVLLKTILWGHFYLSGVLILFIFVDFQHYMAVMLQFGVIYKSLSNHPAECFIQYFSFLPSAICRRYCDSPWNMNVLKILLYHGRVFNITPYHQPFLINEGTSRVQTLHVASKESKHENVDIPTSPLVSMSYFRLAFPQFIITVWTAICHLTLLLIVSPQ